MRGTAIWLACACVLASAGCTHHPHSPVLEILWVDFNIYDRPAIFFDHKSHYPSKAQHVKYYRWLHQPDSGANMTGMPLGAPPEYVVEDPALMPTFTPPANPPGSSLEQAPAPSPELMPAPTRPGKPPAPLPQQQQQKQRQQQQAPREEAPAPPPVQQDKPLRYTVPNGPTARRERTLQQIPTHAAGWNASSGVPVKSLLFAHP